MKKLCCWLGLFLLMGLVAACNQKGEATEQVSLTDLGLHGAVIDPPRNLDDFNLPSSLETDFQLSDYQGKVILLYMGYLTCPDVCPTTMSDLKRAYKGLGEPQDQVQVVFISVDPQRDTLEKIERYMGAFHSDFIGLRGEMAQIQPLMDQLGVQITRHDWKDSAIEYTLDHTANVYLIAPDGRLVEQFIYGTPYQDILTDVRLVLAHYQNN